MNTAENTRALSLVVQSPPFTLNSEWAAYLERVYPEGTAPGQHEEIRNAFYAGALSILRLTLCGTENLSLERTKGVMRELKQFYEAQSK